MTSRSSGRSGREWLEEAARLTGRPDLPGIMEAVSAESTVDRLEKMMPGLPPSSWGDAMERLFVSGASFWNNAFVWSEAAEALGMGRTSGVGAVYSLLDSACTDADESLSVTVLRAEWAKCPGVDELRLRRV